MVRSNVATHGGAPAAGDRRAEGQHPLDRDDATSCAPRSRRSRQSPDIKLVTIEGAGDHFSYGASVEEHRPGR